MVQWEADIYNTPAYAVTDAARYLRIPVVTLRSWLKGRSYHTENGPRTSEPLIQRPAADLAQLSFTNLVEAHVLRIIRENHQVKLDKVRTALDYMSQQLESTHPLATKRFQTDGVDLFVDQIVEDPSKALVNVSRGGQFAMRETLKHLLTRVEWDISGIATRFFPLTERVPTPGSGKVIYLDPAIRFGQPVIAGRGIPTASLADLYDAGDDIEAIADEFDCTPAQVKAAIQFEHLLLAA
jgi:uncharacterized protein (DUF433 family)/transposase-like protein